MRILLALHVDCILDNYRVPLTSTSNKKKRRMKKEGGSGGNTTNVKRFTHKYNSREWKILIYPLWQ